MGILIISIILTIIFAYIMFKTDNTTANNFCSVIITISFVVALIMGLQVGINYIGKNIQKYEMVNRKERIETLLKETESPFYSIFKDSAMVFNNNMKSIKKSNESFWFLGLNSFVSLDTIQLK